MVYVLTLAPYFNDLMKQNILVVKAILFKLADKMDISIDLLKCKLQLYI